MRIAVKVPKSTVRLFIFMKSRMGRGEPCVRLKMVLLFFKELKQANTRFAPTIQLLPVNLGVLILLKKKSFCYIINPWKKN